MIGTFLINRILETSIQNIFDGIFFNFCSNGEIDVLILWHSDIDCFFAYVGKMNVTDFGYGIEVTCPVLLSSGCLTHYTKRLELKKAWNLKIKSDNLTKGEFFKMFRCHISEVENLVLKYINEKFNGK